MYYEEHYNACELHGIMGHRKSAELPYYYYGTT